ncbi:MAG: PilZ domain-containing protein [Nitrospirales bacterium]
MDKRQHPRFPARFHSSFTSVSVVSGEGYVVDLSLRGCCVECDTSVHPGSTLTLRVHMLLDEPSITIGEAVVRWTREGRFGIEFLSLVPEEWARLQHTVTQLELQPYQKKPTDETSEVA